MQAASGIPLNCGTIAGGTNYVYKKPVIGEGSITLEITAVNRITSAGSTSDSTIDDRVMTTETGASYITDYEVNVVQNNPNIFYDTSVTSSNISVLTDMGADFIASGVSAGSAILTATATLNSDIFSSKLAPVSVTTGSSTSYFKQYANGSLAKNASDNIDNAISGKTPSTSKPIFSTQNHSTATYVRNTDCWANIWDLTPISPWNSTGANTRAGTLISPRHIIFAAHYQINNGATVRFIDANNNVVTRTMTNKLTHPNYSPYYPDITIGVLDSDVPNTIGFVKILPQNWATYLPSLSNSYRIPALVLDQEEKALISELKNLSNLASFLYPIDFGAIGPAARVGFYENIIEGDSGNPAFLIINGTLVILTVWTYGGAGTGTNILQQKTDINTMMNTLGGGYSLTEVDLSGFNTY
jgi:hypothetical protein